MFRRPLFHVIGIPVTVDPFFFVGLFIFYSISGGGRAGVYTAVALAVFVLIHELGHATVARRFGGDVAISLNFMVGWASYSHSRTLARWERNVISAAGPLTELVVAIAALWVVRVWLLPIGDEQSLRLYLDLNEAITFAGIMLAVLNLMPLWPLDGGHITESFASQRFGLRGRRAFLIWTIAASVGMALFGLIENAAGDEVLQWANRLRSEALFDPLLESVGKVILSVPALALSSGGFIFIWLFCAFGSYQALQAQRAVESRIVGGAPSVDHRAVAREEATAEARSAERRGWTYHERQEFPRGWTPSPWLAADLARRDGATTGELTAVLSPLASPTRTWVLDRYDRPEVGALLPYVPPTAANTPAVVEVRVFHGSPEDLISAALATFHGDPRAEGFYVVAEGLAQRGLHDDAMSWLTSAVQQHPDPRRVATSRPLSALHGRSDFQQLLGVAERAVAPPRRG